MTDEELAAIKAHAEEAQRLMEGSLTIPRDKLDWLVAEYAIAASQEYVPALLTEVERLREIVRAVATENTLAFEGEAGDEVGCVFCIGARDKYSLPIYQTTRDFRTWKHTPDCPVTKARAVIQTGPLESD